MDSKCCQQGFFSDFISLFWINELWVLSTKRDNYTERIDLSNHHGVLHLCACSAWRKKNGQAWRTLLSNMVITAMVDGYH